MPEGSTIAVLHTCPEGPPNTRLTLPAVGSRASPPSPILHTFCSGAFYFRFFTSGFDGGIPVGGAALPCSDSPTHQSPYHLADRGTVDVEESSDDDDRCRGEHLAPADPASFALYHADQDPYLANRRQLGCPIRPPCTDSVPLLRNLLRDCYALPTPHTTPLSPFSSPFPRYPSPPLPKPTPPPKGPTYVLRGSPGKSLAARVVHTPGPGYESGEFDSWYLLGQVDSPTTLEGSIKRVIELATTVDQEDEIIYSQLDDARYDRALLRARVNMLKQMDRPFHRRNCPFDRMRRPDYHRAAWARSMELPIRFLYSECISLHTTSWLSSQRSLSSGHRPKRTTVITRSAVKQTIGDRAFSGDTKIVKEPHRLR
ncbi:hypothetical protein Tco_1282587 [Tanacetum coccineum]